MDRFLFALTLVTALGCGLNAGVFFAFSGFVIKALARLHPAQGVATMQAINVAAFTPAFMAALFGTAVACGVLAVWTLFAWDERFAPYLLVGSLLYLVGTVLLTIAYHVPRNDALARVEPHSADAESHWVRYLSGWTAWNHVRAAASIAGAATLTIALHIG
jgi:uncharacterized membrane protein